jgi:hypothetical protein
MQFATRNAATTFPDELVRSTFTKGQKHLGCAIVNIFHCSIFALTLTIAPFSGNLGVGVMDGVG